LDQFIISVRNWYKYIVEVNNTQNISSILYPDQESKTNEQPRKRGRPRKVVSPEPAQQKLEPEGITKPVPYVWPFPRFAFSPEITSKTTSFDTARIGGSGSHGTVRTANPDKLASADESRGSGVGSPVLGNEPKRRRGRPPKNAGILVQQGSVSVTGSTSEANKVQTLTENVAETLAIQSPIGDQPVKKRRGRPPKVKPLDN
jgi:hypothetical protein